MKRVAERQERVETVFALVVVEVTIISATDTMAVVQHDVVVVATIRRRDTVVHIADAVALLDESAVRLVERSVLTVADGSRVAEAKAKEEKARKEALAAKNKKEREAAEKRAREAEQKRLEAERKAEAENREHAKAVASARKEADEALSAPTEDMRISGSFGGRSEGCDARQQRHQHPW